MGQGPARSRQQLQAVEKRQLEQELDHAGHEHSPGQGIDRLAEQRRRQQRRRNQGQVQQDGCKRGHRKAAVAVENGAAHAREGDQHQVGEGDADQVGGQGKLVGLADKTGREQSRDERRRQQRQRREAGEDDAEHAGDVVDKVAHAVHAAPLALLREHGHEGLGKGALGKQAPQKVGNLEGNEERVGVGAGTDHRRQHHVAHQPQHPRQHGHGADHRTGAQQPPRRRAAGLAAVAGPRHGLRRAPPSARADARRAGRTTAGRRACGRC
jgi:hypothetical protein